MLGMGTAGWWLGGQGGDPVCPALSPVASAALAQPSLPIQGVPRCAGRGLCPCQGARFPPLPSILCASPCCIWGSEGCYPLGGHRTVPVGTGRCWQPQNNAGSCLPAVLQSARGVVQLRGRASELEAELAEQRHLKQQAQDESEFLRTELEELKKQREDTEKAQRSLTEIESEHGEPAPGWG